MALITDYLVPSCYVMANSKWIGSYIALYAICLIHSFISSMLKCFLSVRVWLSKQTSKQVDFLFDYFASASVGSGLKFTLWVFISRDTHTLIHWMYAYSGAVFSTEITGLVAFTSSDTFRDCTSLEDKEENVFSRWDRDIKSERGGITGLKCYVALHLLTITVINLQMG